MNTPKNNQGLTASDAPGVALLATLRRQMPVRPLAYWEHLAIAERQATKLLTLHDQLEPGVSLDWLSSNTLGNIVVVPMPQWKMEGLSGAAKWQPADGYWTIAINKGNPHARRRFTLAHEFKHVLDSGRDKLTYRDISATQREQIADYFAACYLMPKLALRRAWTNGIQDPEALAGLFKVSLAAMRNRLKHLQYVDDEPDRPVTTYFRQQADYPADRLTARSTGSAGVGFRLTSGPRVVNGISEDELDEPCTGLVTWERSVTGQAQE